MSQANEADFCHSVHFDDDEGKVLQWMLLSNHFVEIRWLDTQFIEINLYSYHDKLVSAYDGQIGEDMV